MKFASLAFLSAAIAVVHSPASAAEISIDVVIKNHQFTPAEIHVPAHQAVVLTITNEDSLAEEFDSTALKVEKVIAGGKQGSVRLRPLERGRYAFMGEYHADTARGVVVAE